MRKLSGRELRPYQFEIKGIFGRTKIRQSMTDLVLSIKKPTFVRIAASKNHRGYRNRNRQEGSWDSRYLKIVALTTARS